MHESAMLCCSWPGAGSIGLANANTIKIPTTTQIDAVTTLTVTLCCVHNSHAFFRIHIFVSLISPPFTLLHVTLPLLQSEGWLHQGVLEGGRNLI